MKEKIQINPCPLRFFMSLAALSLKPGGGLIFN